MTSESATPETSLTPSVVCANCGCAVSLPIEPAAKTDGREPGNWQPRYEGEAANQICHEAIYVAVVFVVLLLLIGALLFGGAHDVLKIGASSEAKVVPVALALLGGALGGTMFSMKWLYHSVAKFSWNADRRLWRYFTPALSGGGALCVVLLSISGVLPLFGPDVVQTDAGALGVSVVLGYFSDRVFSALEGFAKQNIGTSKDSDASQKARA